MLKDKRKRINLQLREQGLILKEKEMKGLMWFFEGATCKLR